MKRGRVTWSRVGSGRATSVVSHGAEARPLRSPGWFSQQRIDLAASCVGIVRPKARLTLGDKLGAGDAIVLLASSGIHANGISLARKLAERLPDGYATKLDDGTTVR